MHIEFEIEFAVSVSVSVSVCTVSRAWRQVRTPARLCPSARSGHAGLRAGAHFYIFGGEAQGHSYNDLWRFHFGTYFLDLLLVPNRGMFEYRKSHALM